MRGFIFLHRKTFENPIMRKPNYLAVWMYLLSNANHKYNEMFWNGEITIVKRGELITSIKGIAEYFGLGISTVSRILSIFEREKMIIKTSNNKFTTVEITNYNKYQTFYDEQIKTSQPLIEYSDEKNNTKAETKKNTKTLANKVQNEFKNTKRNTSGNQTETNNNDNNDKNNINVQNEFEQATISSLNKETNKEELLRIEFEEFWNYYDKKVGRMKCLKKWKKLSVTDKNKIREHLPKYIKATPDIQYRKNPFTYLNNESWNDEIINKTNAVEYNQQHSLVNQIGVQ